MGQNQHSSFHNDLDIKQDTFLEVQQGRRRGEEMFGMASRERTLPNVLSRIKYILDKKGDTPQPYKDAEFKQFWLPDSESKLCYDCSDKFNPFRRRHHCRICGQIFCKNCCNKMVPGKIMGYTGELRVCMFCCKVTVSFLKSTNVEEDILADLKAVQEQLLPNEQNYDNFEVSFAGNTNNAVRIDGKPNVNCKRKGMYGFMEENYAVQSRTLNDREVQQISSERQLLLKDSEQLHSLWSQMVGNSSSSLPLSTNRWKLKVFPYSFIGRECVQWLIENDKASSRQSAIAIGQALLEAGYIFCMCQNNQIFVDDYLIYTIIKSVDLKNVHSSSVPHSQDGGHEPLWLKQIKSQSDGGKYGERNLGSLQKYDRSYANLSNLESEYNLSNCSYSLDMNLEEKKVSMRSLKKKREAEIDNCDSNFQSSITSVLNSTFSPELASGSSLMTEEVLQAIKSLEAKEAEKRAAGWQHPIQLSELLEPEQQLDDQTKLSLTVQERFNTLWSTHEKMLLYQLLNSSGLSSSWADTIMPMVYKVVETVQPDVKNECDEMDIRSYIQFKKVPGGKRKDCLIINGTVCSKNIVHRSMKSFFNDPQILLISCDIDHTAKTESQILSVNNVISQEADYLKRVMPKIISFRPDIILCGKRITFNAREQLKTAGITLVMNLKQSVMARVARCTQASIINSVETDLTSVPINLLSVSRPLGMCHSFYLRHYNLPNSAVPKTLMFFDGCATHLGCTIILRGASSNELKKVKQIMYFLIFALHNWKLERSFLMDEYAFYPSFYGDSFPSDLNNDSKEDCAEHITKKVDEKEQENMEYRRKIGEMDEKLGSKGVSFLPDALEVEDTSIILNDNLNWDRSQENSTLFMDKLHEVLQRETILKIDGQHITLEETPIFNNDSNICDRKIYPSDNSANSENLYSILSKEGDEREEYKADKKSTYPAHSTPDKNLTILIEDCSDPLQSYLKKNFDNSFDNKTECSLALTNDLSNNDYFKANVKRIILSVSPYLKYNIPYMVTESGRNSALRKYLPMNLYFSPLLEGKKTNNKAVCYNNIPKEGNNNIEIKPLHYFVLSKLTKSARSLSVKADLVDFRARGCTITNICTCNERKEKSNFTNKKIIMALDEVISTKKKERSYNIPVNTSDGHIDALHPYNHQRISVLFSNFSSSYEQCSTFCVDPRVLTMCFYGMNDIPLGAYLERYCFDMSYKCPSEECNAHCLHHVRKFIHEDGCLEILLRKLEMALGNANPLTIYMWTWCKQCKQVSPVVPMSSDTWRFSFAKYIELLFHEKTINRRGCPGCHHSIHQEHYHYFSLSNTIAVFRSTDIDIRELIIPPPEIIYHLRPAQKSFIVDQIKFLAIQGFGLFSLINDRLTKLSEEIGQSRDPMLGYVSSHHQQQKKVFKEGIESIQMQLTSPSLERRSLGSSSPTSCQELTSIMYGILDQVVIIKRLLVTVVNDWNTKVQTLYQLKKKEERSDKPKVTSSDHATNIGSGRQSSVHSSSATSNNFSDGLLAENASSMSISSIKTTTEKGNVESALESSITLSVEEKRRNMVRSSSNPEPTMDLAFSASCVFEAANQSSIGSTSGFNTLKNENDICEGIETICNTSSVDENSKRNTTEPAGGSARSGLQTFISPVKTCQHHERSLSDDIEISNAKETIDRVPEKRYSSSVKNIISTLLSSSADLMIKSPFDPNEHYGVLPEIKIPLVLYDDEPSSIIAVSLASQEYETQLQVLQLKLNESQLYYENIQQSRSTDNQNVSSSNSVEASSSSDNSSILGTPTSGQKSEEIPQKNHHIELQWNDPHANYYCKIYFAERFRRLRSLVFPYGEELFIRSLSRCIIWEARGGKSGSFFCKTTDERFVLKEMSKLEVNSFFDFAPDYIQYITECYKNNQPTTLTRIVGVFRIGFKNTTTGRQQKCDLLVMENLFYQRSIRAKYDLKGSVRNRKVEAKGEADTVLLDENLIQTASSSQFFLRPHDKTILMKAIDTDSAFLSKHFIMDYSLLVGLDVKKKEIVVGIIDYIRTFTWDKRLETIIKGSVLSAGTGKQPTIISPELYRKRFCVAMEKYFAVCPDRWSGLAETLNTS